MSPNQKSLRKFLTNDEDPENVRNRDLLASEIHGCDRAYRPFFFKQYTHTFFYQDSVPLVQRTAENNHFEQRGHRPLFLKHAACLGVSVLEVKAGQANNQVVSSRAPRGTPLPSSPQ
jgi:hypothetical protein